MEIKFDEVWTIMLTLSLFYNMAWKIPLGGIEVFYVFLIMSFASPWLDSEYISYKVLEMDH